MLLVEAWLQSSQVPTAQYRPILQWCWGEWSIRDKAGVRAEAVTAKEDAPVEEDLPHKRLRLAPCRAKALAADLSRADGSNAFQQQ